MKVPVILILTVFAFFTLSCKSTKTIAQAEYTQTMIDSLKHEIYQDTVKFNEKDLIFTQIGRRNVNSYSMLYLVNGVFLYMLDIIPSDKVVEFVSEFLNSDKIESIGIIPKEKAYMFGGVRAQNGLVVIRLKKKVKFNPLVAGFEKRGENSGDNFSKRRANELMIRE